MNKIENLYTPNCIRTFSGIYVNIIEPTIDMFNIEDIAHSLSFQCRFAGHMPDFYSVAQHSIYCAENVSIENRLAALLHDASEAYLVDIPSPIKQHLTNYKELEDKIMKLISQKFGFDYPFVDEIKVIDKVALEFEWDTLVINPNIIEPKDYISPSKVKMKFINMFNSYSL